MCYARHLCFVHHRLLSFPWHKPVIAFNALLFMLQTGQESPACWARIVAVTFRLMHGLVRGRLNREQYLYKTQSQIFPKYYSLIQFDDQMP